MGGLGIGTTAACVAALALGGCLESRHGAVAGDAGGDTGAVGVGCTNARLTVTADGRHDAAAWRLVAASSSSVLYSGGEWAYGQELGLRALDVDRDEVHALPGSAPMDVLIDAHGAATLVLRPTDDPARRTLYYADGERWVPLFTDTDDERVVHDLFYGGAVSRTVAVGYAAWETCRYDDYSRCGERRVHVWRDGEPGRVVVEGYEPTAVVVDDRGVIWVEPVAAGDATGEAGRARLHGWDGGEPVVLREVAADVRMALRVGDALVWLGPEGVWRAEGDGPETLISPRYCSAAASDGAHALLLCVDVDPRAGGPINRWSYFPGVGDQLWLTDGARMVAVASDAPALTAPAVHGDVVAWVSYDDPQAGCYPEVEAGTVWAAPVAAPGRAVAVGAIGSGCYCCDSIWPEVQLSTYGGLLAWNYGVDAAAEPPGPPYEPRGGFLAWARVEVACD